MKNKGQEDISMIINCLSFFSKLLKNELKRIISVESHYEYQAMTVKILWLDNDDNIRENIVNEHQLGGAIGEN